MDSTRIVTSKPSRTSNRHKNGAKRTEADQDCMSAWQARSPRSLARMSRKKIFPKDLGLGLGRSPWDEAEGTEGLNVGQKLPGKRHNYFRDWSKGKASAVISHRIALRASLGARVLKRKSFGSYRGTRIVLAIELAAGREFQTYLQKLLEVWPQATLRNGALSNRFAEMIASFIRFL